MGLKPPQGVGGKRGERSLGDKSSITPKDMEQHHLLARIEKFILEIVNH